MPRRKFRVVPAQASMAVVSDAEGALVVLAVLYLAHSYCAAESKLKCVSPRTEGGREERV